MRSSRGLLLLLALTASLGDTTSRAEPLSLTFGHPGRRSYQPLETVLLVGTEPHTVVVTDADGHEYVRKPPAARLEFQVGGALGTHLVRLLDEEGITRARATFEVDTETLVDDAGGPFGELYEMARDTLTVVDPTGDNGGAGRGGHLERSYRGRSYRLFVSWVLDQAEVSKGMAFFSPHIRDGVVLFRETQRADGMIWSFVEPDLGIPGYYDTLYGEAGYVRREGGALLVRQPVENHGEYQFVSMLHRAWQASGDDRLLRESLPAAMRALDYAKSSPVRFSHRFALLKRPYTIDSWDFQVDDAYTARSSLMPTMTIDPERTKFGVFFGDNTGYVHACERLAEMLTHLGEHEQAAHYREQKRRTLERLTKVAWNGHFYRHFVEEDDSVRRELGVDESAQIAQANAYSLNRGIPHAQAAAIVRTYMRLRDQLPPGAPGEWFSIYPPFERGFTKHAKRWQYVNGGLSGHAAGELARGALGHGFESYGVSVLRRAAELAQRTDRKIHFAYTGAFPESAEPARFTPISLAEAANMDVRAPSPGRAWMEGEPGNDLGSVPRTLTAGGAPFELSDGARQRGRVVIAVSRQPGYPRQVELPLPSRPRAAALFLLHTMHRGQNRPEEVAAAITLHYADGGEHASYLRRGRHVSGWWYPELPGPHAGVALRGANARTGDVGLTWAMLENPAPERALRAITISASLEGSVYALAGLTLAERLPEARASAVSYGGPDTWAASTMMLALLEGLGGVRDLGRGLDKVELSPRWTAAERDQVRVRARYGASRGYAAYDFRHDRAGRRLSLRFTGSARKLHLRVLLPEGAAVRRAELDGRPVAARETRVEGSRYAELSASGGVHELVLHYRARP